MGLEVLLALACGAAAWLVGTLALHYLAESRMPRRVRAMRAAPGSDYVEERREWLADHQAGLWLVHAALENARSNPTPEAVAFYQQLAKEWNENHPHAAVTMQDWQRSDDPAALRGEIS